MALHFLGCQEVIASQHPKGFLPLYRTILLSIASIILANAHPFAYRRENVAMEKKLLYQNKQFSIYEVSFPSPVQSGWRENDTVFVYLFSPPAEPKGKILVLHTLRSKDVDLEKEICRRFAQLGYESAVLVLPYHLRRCPPGLKRAWGFLSSPSTIRTTIIQSVVDVRRFIDLWLKGDERLAIVGVSLGAIISSLTMAVDQRISMGVFLLGGGNLPHLLSHSLVLFPEAFKWRKVDWSILEDVDPIKYASLIPPRPVLMVNGRLDLVVPYNSSFPLWKQMGEPQVEWLLCGHYGAFLLKDKILREVLKFITDKIGGVRACNGDYPS